MPTVNDVITDAYGEIGVYGPSDTISTTDSAFAIRRLNMIFDAWAAQPLMSPAPTQLDIPVVAGVADYNFGSLGSGNVQPYRLGPVRIARLSYPNSNPLLYPLQILGLEDFQYLKSRRYFDVAARPDTLVYQNAIPNTIITLAPTPDQNCTVRIWYTYQQFVAATLTDGLVLSQGYYKALVLQLAMELAPSFGATVNPVTQAAWQDAIRAVKAQNVTVEGTPYDSRMPGMRGRFDIVSGLEY